MSLSIAHETYQLAGRVVSNAVNLLRQSGHYRAYVTVHPEVAHTQFLAIGNSVADGFGQNDLLPIFHNFYDSSVQQAEFALTSQRPANKQLEKLHDKKEPRHIAAYIGENELSTPNWVYDENLGIITVIQGVGLSDEQALALTNTALHLAKKGDIINLNIPGFTLLESLVTSLNRRLKNNMVGVAVIAESYNEGDETKTVPLISRTIGRGSPYNYNVVYEKARAVSLTNDHSGPQQYFHEPKVSTIRGGRLLGLKKHGKGRDTDIIIAVGGLDQHEDVQVVREALEQFNQLGELHGFSVIDMIANG